MQETILLKYLKNHKVEEAIDALQNLKLNRKTMCSLLITKTLGKSGDYMLTNLYLYYALRVVFSCDDRG